MKRPARTATKKRPSRTAASLRQKKDRLWSDGPTPPQGFAYEWKVTHVLGVALDPSELQDAKNAGWTPVPRSRHGKFKVECFGCRLMERPIALHEAAVKQAAADAHAQHRAMMKVARDGLESLANGSHVMTDYGWVPLQLWREMESLFEVVRRWEPSEDVDRLIAFFRQPEDNG